MAVCGSHLWGGATVAENVKGRPCGAKWQHGWKISFLRTADLRETSFSQGSRTQNQFKCLRVVGRAANRGSQNVDLPVAPSKKRIKPRTTVKRPAKKKYGKRPLVPILREPANGLLVQRFIPIAHDVLAAKSVLIEGVNLLLKATPFWACRFCTEVHVGLIGHTMPTCIGPYHGQRHSLHDWRKGSLDDVVVPVEAYHLEDRLALPIAHNQRFDLARISAIEELCIQAGVDIPDYPTRRYSEPILSPDRTIPGKPSWIGQEIVEQLLGRSTTDEYDASEGEVNALTGNQESESTVGKDHIVDGESPVDSNEEEIEALAELASDDDLPTVAQKTLQAWERMRAGAKKLKMKYKVYVCGYCPEVHVGPRGHRAQVCGAFKHQWRNGQHAWQNASIDYLIPPQYVWHIRDKYGPPLHKTLERFYGKAPAVVELCVQAGAPIPDRHRPLMRIDIVIPTIEELQHVI